MFCVTHKYDQWQGYFPSLAFVNCTLSLLMFFVPPAYSEIDFYFIFFYCSAQLES